MRENKKQAPIMRVRDMTEGDPIRLILAFAVSLFIGNIFQQIYTMVVGHSLGDGTIGMNSGYGIVVTQNFGSRDQTAMRRSVAGMGRKTAPVVLNCIELAMKVLAGSP